MKLFWSPLVQRIKQKRGHSVRTCDAVKLEKKVLQQWKTATHQECLSVAACSHSAVMTGDGLYEALMDFVQHNVAETVQVARVMHQPGVVCTAARSVLSDMQPGPFVQDATELTLGFQWETVSGKPSVPCSGQRRSPN